MRNSIMDHLLNKNKAVLISVCCECIKMIGIKAGNGVCGVSHGFCGSCLNKNLKKER
jgi:hypothetical protein